MVRKFAVSLKGSAGASRKRARSSACRLRSRSVASLGQGSTSLRYGFLLAAGAAGCCADGRDCRLAKMQTAVNVAAAVVRVRAITKASKRSAVDGGIIEILGTKDLRNLGFRAAAVNSTISSKS